MISYRALRPQGVLLLNGANTATAEDLVDKCGGAAAAVGVDVEKNEASQRRVRADW